MRPARGAPSRSPQRKLRTDRFLVHRDAGTEPVQYNADLFAVAFAEQRHGNGGSDCVFHTVSFRITVSISGRSDETGTVSITYEPTVSTRVTATVSASAFLSCSSAA